MWQPKIPRDMKYEKNIRLKYAQIRSENSFWCPPEFQVKFFVKPSGELYAHDQAKMM